MAESSKINRMALVTRKLFEITDFRNAICLLDIIYGTQNGLFQTDIF